MGCNPGLFHDHEKLCKNFIERPVTDRIKSLTSAPDNKVR